MRGRVCVVTGASSGVGLATASGLAARGATVVLVSRDASRSASAFAAVAGRAAAESPVALLADLASQRSVRDLGEALLARFPRIHVLINNAGIVNPVRRLTTDGIEETLAVNHVAPYLLTRLLMPAFRAAESARIVNVASQVHATDIDFDNLQGEKRYDGLAAYKLSKLANILFTRELARRLEGTGITANALHPGVVSTPLLSGYLTAERRRQPWLRRLLGTALRRLGRSERQFEVDTPEVAAETSIFLATSPDVRAVTGKYFVRSREARPAAAACDLSLAERLWSVSEELTEPSATTSSTATTAYTPETEENP